MVCCTCPRRPVRTFSRGVAPAVRGGGASNSPVARLLEEGHIVGRIRTIKPEFPQSESMGRVSREARLCFILLWTIVDDAGRTRASSRMLASLLYPYDDDAPSLIEGWLVELESERCLYRYEVDGNSYLQICKWLSHQKIDRPSQSKIPPFDEHSRGLDEPSVKNTVVSVPVPVSSTYTEEGISPEMVAQGVLQELSLSGRDLSVVLEEVCRARIKAGDDPTELRDRIMNSYREFMAAAEAGKFAYRWGLKVFFGEGNWMDSKRWPWRENGANHGTGFKNKYDLAREQIDREALDQEENPHDGGATRGATPLF